MAKETVIHSPLVRNIPFYEKNFSKTGGRAYRWLYWNIMGRGHYIVASVTCYPDPAQGNELACFDWAAYIGSSEASGTKEREGFKEVAAYGAKLSKEVAIACFPILKEISYRG